MGFLTLDAGINMNKVIISVWFRVPTEAADAARGSATFFDYQVFNGVIPFMSWGAQPTATIYGFEQYDSGAVYATFALDEPIMLERLTTPHSAPMPMSYLGVKVGTEESPANTFEVHIQTQDVSTGIGVQQIATSFTGILQEPPEGFTKPIYADVEFQYTDITDELLASPDYFGNSGINAFSDVGFPEVDLDEWHHLLISWELRSHSNASYGSDMWCAIDDKNLVGGDLPAMNDNFSMGPHEHKAWAPYEWTGDPDVSVSIGIGHIPSRPLRIPGPEEVSYATDDHGGVGTRKPVQTVELAELQIWSNRTLDTSVEDNRRVFIDYVRNVDGTPTEDEDGNNTLKPVNPAKAEELLGKPDILLHTSNNWKNGKNTGSLGVDDDGQEIPAGQFTPDRTINRYKPDPSIGVPAG